MSFPTQIKNSLGAIVEAAKSILEITRTELLKPTSGASPEERSFGRNQLTSNVPPHIDQSRPKFKYSATIGPKK